MEKLQQLVGFFPSHIFCLDQFISPEKPGEKILSSLSYENYPEGWHNPELIFLIKCTF